jgi:hypothetical protein
MLHAALGLSLRPLPAILALTLFAFHIAVTVMILAAIKIFQRGREEPDDDQLIISRLNGLRWDEKPAGDFYKLRWEKVDEMPTTPCIQNVL